MRKESFHWAADLPLVGDATHLVPTLEDNHMNIRQAGIRQNGLAVSLHYRSQTILGYLLTFSLEQCPTVRKFAFVTILAGI
jgi:hypothetical protein